MAIVTRNAYLVITHPDNGDIKDVLTITQTAPLITTTAAPVYEFIFSQPESSGIGQGTTEVTISFTWDGPDLDISDFSVSTPTGYYNSSQIVDVYNNGTGSTNDVVVQLTSSQAGTPQDITVSFIGVNNYTLSQSSITQVTFSWTPCHVEGTVMYLADGSTKLVEDLLVGDVLKSYVLDGLSTDDNAWSTYNQTAGTFGATESTVTVVSIKPGQYTQYLNFNNGISKVTGEHVVVIKDADDNVSFKMARQAVVGDSFYTNGTWSVITSIETVNETVNTYSIDTEEGDVYVADGILWHNVEQLKVQ